MKRIKGYAILTLVLCFFVVLGIVASHLALTDIFHGVEPNLEVEWWVVRITFTLVGVLVLSATLLTIKILQRDS
jgi:hypothetical protein